MLPHLLLHFYPSYAAFTFPLVISATALFTAVHYFDSLGMNTGVLNILKVIECGIATVMVLTCARSLPTLPIKGTWRKSPLIP